MLIVNADDFGMTPGVNAGVAEGHDRGIVTSASLMVRHPAVTEAAQLARGRPLLSLGLHLDLGEWTYSGGAWEQSYEVVALDDAQAVSQVVSEQITAFRELVGRVPTHLDSHQHVHRDEPAASIVGELGRELGLVVRGSDARVRYRGDFYGQTGRGEPLPEAIRPERLIELIEDLGPGITELACHPALWDDTASSYGEERERELEALCDPRVRAALEDAQIELTSFADPRLSATG